MDIDELSTLIEKTTEARARLILEIEKGTAEAVEADVRRTLRQREQDRQYQEIRSVYERKVKILYSLEKAQGGMVNMLRSFLNVEDKAEKDLLTRAGLDPKEAEIATRQTNDSIREKIQSGDLELSPKARKSLEQLELGK